jgi:hypothetical protein
MEPAVEVKFRTFQQNDFAETRQTEGPGLGVEPDLDSLGDPVAIYQ